MATALGALALVSCGGGGGGGGASNLLSNPSGSFLGSAAEPSLPAVAGDWSGSAEYANSTGLAQLKAAEGYARRSGGLAGGQGVRIAIIDSGIDVTHPDLGNLASTSWSAGGESLAGNSHATFVAGIAGATRSQSTDPNDMHGMAYKATLVNFQASRPSQGGNSFATSDLVDAIHAASGLIGSASAVESDILNLSLGALSTNDDSFAALRTAMRAAAAEGKIMVLAVGNEGQSSDPSDKLQPIYPAAYADDSGIAGLAIAVGNLNASNQVATSSSYCGDTQNYCLFASGTDIRSTLNGGGYGIGSGTSFAAPYVSGAAAVVKAAFPGVSSQDVVNRLLLTAADLGAAGVDSIYGRGRLDLEAAMAPVGPTGFPIGPTVDGEVIPIEASALRLGSGFALSDASRKALAGAISVDSMGFPFPIDLGEAVETVERNDGLSTFVSGRRHALASMGSARTHLAAFVSDEAVRDDRAAPSSLGPRARDDDALPISFAADVTEWARVFASLNGERASGLGLEAGLAERRAALMQADGFFAPYEDVGGPLSGGGFSLRPVEGTEIAVAAFNTIADDAGPAASLQRVEVAQVMPGKIELRLGLSLIQEEGAYLGGSASGAFGDDTSAHSQALAVSLIIPLTDDIDGFTTYSRGRSSVEQAEGGLIADWSDGRSESFGAGLVMRNIARDDDGLTLAIGQPFRQEQAEATIDLPVARRPDGTVVTRRERLDFAPKAREITTEIGYRLPFGREGVHDLRAAGFVRVNPDHDGERDPEAGIGLAFRLRF